MDTKRKLGVMKEIEAEISGTSRNGSANRQGARSQVFWWM